MNDFNRGALPVPCLRLDFGFGEQWESIELGDGTGYVRLADYKSVQAENVELRRLVRKYGEYTSQDRCEGCFCKSRCNDGDVDECWQLTEIRELARKLEAGVDE